MAVLMAHKKLDVPPTFVPDESVAAYEAGDWQRVPDSKYGDAVARLSLPVNPPTADAVVMVHKKEKSVLPAVVPAASVAAYEAQGWRRANKSMQAEADAIGAEQAPVPNTAQEG